MQIRIGNFFEHLLWRSWWVILFILACCMLFEHAVYPQRQEYANLSAHLEELKMQTKLALSLQSELLRQVNSESDPAWIELTLMKGLGLVPEEQTKVYFVMP